MTEMLFIKYIDKDYNVRLNIHPTACLKEQSSSVNKEDKDLAVIRYIVAKKIEMLVLQKIEKVIYSFSLRCMHVSQ